MFLHRCFIIFDTLLMPTFNESFQIIDDVIYVYFVAEMLIKMVSIKDAFFVEFTDFYHCQLLQIALGVVGKGCYLQETWNKLDCFIVVSG